MRMFPSHGLVITWSCKSCTVWTDTWFVGSEILCRVFGFSHCFFITANIGGLWPQAYTISHEQWTDICQDEQVCLHTDIHSHFCVFSVCVGLKNVEENGGGLVLWLLPICCNICHFLHANEAERKGWLVQQRLNTFQTIGK